MKATELHELLRLHDAPTVIDVMPEEIHSAKRIPGSINACVYETAFPDKIAAIIPSLDTPLVVCGAGGGSRDAMAAMEKLHNAGYQNVRMLDDGIAAWEAAGYPVDGSGRLPQPPALDGRYALDIATSVIRWTGRNLFNHHSGTLRLASGEIDLANGTLKAARFVIDMDSIACEDLTERDWNAMLIRHLKDADFFETSRHPTAEFVAVSAEPLPDASEGRPNFRIKGNLTLRGVTRPLEFPAVIAAADGRSLTGQAQVEIDRTEFGSIYGSGRFFSYLGKHVVNDHIQLHLKIHAVRG